MPDSREDALAYLDSLSHGMIRPELAEAFVDTGARGRRLAGDVDAAAAAAGRRASPTTTPSTRAGSRGGGRSLEPELFPFERLGRLGRPGGRHAAARMRVTETPLGGGTGSWPPRSRRAAGAPRRRGPGPGVGRRAAARLPRPRRRARAPEPARSELVVEDGGVAGVALRRSDGPSGGRRRGAVVLATGGFECDDDLVRAFLRGPMREPGRRPDQHRRRPADGDAGRRARSGRCARRGGCRSPHSPATTPTATSGPAGPARADPAAARSWSTAPARRFTNEAANYNALGGAFHQFDPALVRLRQPALLAGLRPGFRRPRTAASARPPGGPLPDWVAPRRRPGRAGRRSSASPPTRSRATVDRWNELVAEQGHDDDFGRGDSAYDGWCGDRRPTRARRATLGPARRGAVLRRRAASRRHARHQGRPAHRRRRRRCSTSTARLIPGLYAAGNAMAAPTGMVYGGAGGTLGPALVFGYRAGRAAAARRSPVSAISGKRHLGRGAFSPEKAAQTSVIAQPGVRLVAAVDRDQVGRERLHLVGVAQPPARRCRACRRCGRRAPGRGRWRRGPHRAPARRCRPRSTSRPAAARPRGGGRRRTTGASGSSAAPAAAALPSSRRQGVGALLVEAERVDAVDDELAGEFLAQRLQGLAVAVPRHGDDHDVAAARALGVVGALDAGAELGGHCDARVPRPATRRRSWRPLGRTAWPARGPGRPVPPTIPMTDPSRAGRHRSARSSNSLGILACSVSRLIIFMNSGRGRG